MTSMAAPKMDKKDHVFLRSILFHLAHDASASRIFKASGDAKNNCDSCIMIFHSSGMYYARLIELKYKGGPINLTTVSFYITYLPMFGNRAM